MKDDWKFDPITGVPLDHYLPIIATPLEASRAHVPIATPLEATREPLGTGDELDLWALLGCVFSFIPLVGWITMYMHSDAPMGSSRRTLGTIAGVIGTLSFVNVLLEVTRD